MGERFENGGFLSKWRRNSLLFSGGGGGGAEVSPPPSAMCMWGVCVVSAMCGVCIIYNYITGPCSLMDFVETRK